MKSAAKEKGREAHVENVANQSSAGRLIIMDFLSWTATLLPFFSLIHLGSAIDATNYFISPPPTNGSTPTDGGDLSDNIVWTSWSKVNITYSTNYTSYTVDLYQHLQNAPHHQFIQTVSSRTSSCGQSKQTTPRLQLTFCVQTS